MIDAAVISDNGLHRYLLTRELGGASTVTWIMLNPSTADAAVNDPTIRRCIGFTRAWGYGRLEVVNLFAYRATNPQDVIDSANAGIDVVGSDNDRHLAGSAVAADRVVCAWGAALFAPSRAARVRWLLADHGAWDRTVCLGMTKSGHPRHPLYVKGDTSPVGYL